METTSKSRSKKKLLVASGLFLTAAVTYAATQLLFTPPIELSNQADDLGLAFKTKLVRLGNGTLITAYGDGVDSSNLVYDVKNDSARPARDVFVRTCASFTTDCSLEANWSEPLNISNTALLSSMNTDWDGLTDDSNARKPYYGDSDKPNIVNSGTRVVVSWTDKYCFSSPSAQRSVTYIERDSREVPFSCVHAVHSSDAGKTWSPADQLTDGSRDAKQDAHKGATDGKWIVTWQEDPLGLQLGEGDGPGDGASGAKVSHGTDVWHSTAAPGWTSATDANWAAPSRLTDNATNQASGSFNAIKDADGNIVADADIEGGQTGASRANLALVGTTAVVAYEETKGSEGLDEGKFIRYHSFTFNDAASTNNTAGCIISAPTENSRRVRFVPQATAAAISGTNMGIFWKQGNYDEGGPSDIVLRRSVNGFAASNMMPAVDSGCETSDYLTAVSLNNVPGLNISSQTPIATSANLADNTEENNIENALAHRALLRGDDFYIGYSYTPDWAVATYTTLENYNFYLRHYDGATDTWSNPQNLSNLASTDFNVREPRLVGTPSSSDPANPQNKSAFVIAWGLQTNVPEHLGGAEDLDIFYTRTFDKGQTFEPVVTVENPDGNARFESQLRPTPDGTVVHMVWNEKSASGANAMYSSGTTEVLDLIAPEITLLGDSIVTIEAGSVYVDAGATVSDAGDPDVIVSNDAATSVDTSTIGSYIVTFSATDASGNNQTRTREVNVVDTTSPSITLNGSRTVTITPTSTYNDAGATVTDAGDPTVVVTDNASIVNTSTPGSYTITYSATDASGNTATDTRIVTVSEYPSTNSGGGAFDPLLLILMLLLIGAKATRLQKSKI